MANSVTARFNDDCKVFVSMSDDTTVEKAVIIDAEGNETDIGGGSSDFGTVKVVFNNLSAIDPTRVYIPVVGSFDGGSFVDDGINCPAGETTATVIITGVGASGVLSIPDDLKFSNASGGVSIFDNATINVSGDGSVQIVDSTEA